MPTKKKNRQLNIWTPKMVLVIFCAQFTEYSEKTRFFPLKNNNSNNFVFVNPNTIAPRSRTRCYWRREYGTGQDGCRRRRRRRVLTDDKTEKKNQFRLSIARYTLLGWTCWMKPARCGTDTRQNGKLHSVPSRTGFVQYSHNYTRR